MEQLAEAHQLRLMRDFVQAFVSQPKKDRYLEILSSAADSIKVFEDLARRPLFEERVTLKLRGSDRVASSITSELKKLHSPNSVPILSENQKLHGRIMEIREALRMTLGSGLVTIFVCIPFQLAFFEGERGEDRFILNVGSR